MVLTTRGDTFEKISILHRRDRDPRGILFVRALPASAQLDPKPGTLDDDIPLISDHQDRKIDETRQQGSQLLLSAVGGNQALSEYVLQ